MKHQSQALPRVDTFSRGSRPSSASKTNELAQDWKKRRHASEQDPSASAHNARQSSSRLKMGSLALLTSTLATWEAQATWLVCDLLVCVPLPGTWKQCNLQTLSYCEVSSPQS